MEDKVIELNESERPSKTVMIFMELMMLSIIIGDTRAKEEINRRYPETKSNEKTL